MILVIINFGHNSRQKAKLMIYKKQIILINYLLLIEVILCKIKRDVNGAI